MNVSFCDFTYSSLIKVIFTKDFLGKSGERFFTYDLVRFG